MAINLSFLSETLSPVSKGSAAQPAAAVACLRRFGETQPSQCHLSPSFLGSGEGVAYYFTVYVSWSDSLIRPGGHLLWYRLCLWPLFLVVVYTASFLWRFSKWWKPKSYWVCLLFFGFFLVFFPPPSTSANSQWLWHQWFWFSVERMWGGDSPMPHWCYSGGQSGFFSLFSEVLNYFDTVTKLLDWGSHESSS